MFFEVAGITTQPWIPPLVALGISFFASMGGVSGAFLLLPFQMSVLGYVNPSVSATNQFYNIVAIPSGVWRYVREGRMVWPLAWTVILGTLPGVFLGALLRIRYLPDAHDFKLFASGVLLLIGLRMARSLRRSGHAAAGAAADETANSAVRMLRFDARRIAFEFSGAEYSASTPGIATLALGVGVIGGAYGIGGGAFIVPCLVTFFGLPIYAIAGAALMSTCVTSFGAVIFYEFLSLAHPGAAVAPDWGLGMLFGLGGMIGMYLGARCQRHVPARLISGLLAALILFLAAKYALDFFG